MITDNVKARGIVTFELTDEHGNIKQTVIENLVVSTGFSHFTSRLLGTTQDIISHIAAGTGDTAPALGQTGLTAEIARVGVTSYLAATTVNADDSVEAVATFPAGTATGALEEIGLFNAASSGVMISRTTFAVINKGALDTLTVTWKIRFA